MASRTTFRVFIKTTGKYLVSSKSKSSWQTMRWAIRKAKDSRYSLDDLEIHEFPMIKAIIHNPTEVLNQLRERDHEKQKSDRLAREERERKIIIERAKEQIREGEKLLEKYTK